MKVSIITTTFNSADTIKDTLDSVAQQTHANIEHVIIDSQSSDNTLEIVARYPHVSKVICEKDKGIYYGMNKGLEIATGDIICFLNSDDWYAHKNVVRDVVKEFSNSDTDVIYGDLQYVDREKVEVIKRTWHSGKFNRKKMFYGWMPPHPTFFVLKKVYDKVGGYNTIFRSAADYEIMLRILVLHKFNAGYVPEILVKMRTGGFSNSTVNHRIKANSEDIQAWLINGLKPHFLFRYLKPLRKIPQFIFR